MSRGLPRGSAAVSRAPAADCPTDRGRIGPSARPGDGTDCAGRLYRAGPAGPGRAARAQTNSGRTRLDPARACTGPAQRPACRAGASPPLSCAPSPTNLRRLRPSRSARPAPLPCAVARAYAVPAAPTVTASGLAARMTKQAVLGLRGARPHRAHDPPRASRDGGWPTRLRARRPWCALLLSSSEGARCAASAWVLPPGSGSMLIAWP